MRACFPMFLGWKMWAHLLLTCKHSALNVKCVSLAHQPEVSRRFATWSFMQFNPDYTNLVPLVFIWLHCHQTYLSMLCGMFPVLWGWEYSWQTQLLLFHSFLPLWNLEWETGFSKIIQSSRLRIISNPVRCPQKYVSDANSLSPNIVSISSMSFPALSVLLLSNNLVPKPMKVTLLSLLLVFIVVYDSPGVSFSLWSTWNFSQSRIFCSFVFR